MCAFNKLIGPDWSTHEQNTNEQKYTNTLGEIEKNASKAEIHTNSHGIIKVVVLNVKLLLTYSAQLYRTNCERSTFHMWHSIALSVRKHKNVVIEIAQSQLIASDYYVIETRDRAKTEWKINFFENAKFTTFFSVLDCVAETSL